MHRFAMVEPGLYRGSAPSTKDLELFKDVFGIKRIISLDETEGKNIKNKCKSLGLEHYIVPLGDGKSPNIGFITDNLDKLLKSGKKTFIHCRHGKDRTGMICAMYRLSNGWDLKKALKEAKDFGMGDGLPDNKAKSYYDAVKDFAGSDDENDAQDIVSVQRDDLQMDDIARGVNDYSISNPDQMSFAPFSSDINTMGPVMNTLAAADIYTFANNENELMQPDRKWYLRKDLMQNMRNGSLYSAQLFSDINVEQYNNSFNVEDLRQAKLADADVVYFNNVIIVITPDALSNIIKEPSINEDSNHILDVGIHTNYDGMADNWQPGGGAMESGNAGLIQLPSGDQL